MAGTFEVDNCRPMSAHASHSFIAAATMLVGAAQKRFAKVGVPIMEIQSDAKRRAVGRKPPSVKPGLHAPKAANLQPERKVKSDMASRSSIALFRGVVGKYVICG